MLSLPVFLQSKLVVITTLALVLLASLFLVATPALAACTSEGGADCVTNAINSANNGQGGQIDFGSQFGFSSLNQAISTIISLVFLGAGVLAFFFILLGAFNYLTAGDDSAKTEKARKQITNAVIGLILVALVYVIWLIAINLIPGLSDFFDTVPDDQERSTL